jgi:acetyl-CoA C-acetyltransferase
VNPSGGLKSKGHPVGATGVAQVLEVVKQLRGDCAERQVKGARVGMAQNMGGVAGSCVVHILGSV